MRVGIDIGGTNTDGVVLDDAGTVVHSLRLPTGWGPDAVLATATAAIRELAEESGVSPARFTSIGVGIPGAVDVERGTVTHARNLGVQLLDLGHLLEDELAATVRVENDVNAAALGAFHQLSLADPDSLAYLNLGTGLAAGLVLGGELWRGSRGAAGEIGHILIDPAGPPDADGQPGALEVLASGSGIASQRPGSVTDMLVAAAAGDARALEIRDRMFVGVASAIRILVLTLDVDVVVIGGGISNMGNELLDAVRRIVADWESASPFITSLELGGRMRILPPGLSTAAIGAAWLGRTPWQK
ncbi:MAG TPA: ROK family protein [Galbitalea sp.]|nr:ROK family protein [Galbitalea sp.]